MTWVAKWMVDSRGGDKKYTVSLSDAGVFGCNCLAWTRRRIECRHIHYVKGNYMYEIDKAIARSHIPLKWSESKEDWVKVTMADKVNRAETDPDSDEPGEETASAPTVLSLIQKQAQWRL